MENANENQKSCSDLEKSARPEILDELENPRQFCNSRCSICHSGILPDIHEWRKSGDNFDQIVQKAAEIKGVPISAPSLCRHFQSFNKWRSDQATLIIKSECLEEITAQSVHIRRTVELLDMAYDQIKAKMQSGLYKVDISDLEKLTKMRYQILNGQSTDEKDLFMIFQKASDQYGLNLQQATLFSR